MAPLIALACVLGVLVGVAIAAVRIYNTLMQSSQLTGNSFAQIEVQLKRRYDLIPSLVESTKAYLGHERETLEAVIKARQQASADLSGLAGKLNDPSAMKSLGASEGALSGAMGRLSMVIESYPELKANETVASLMEELTSTENRISFARQLYNDMVTKFNIQRRSFPTILISGLVGYSSDMNMLEYNDTPEIQHAPKVDFALSGS